MKTVLLTFSASLFAAASSFAQLVINEICASENMNGVMVGAEEFNGTIYSTGFFTELCGDQAAHVAQWNGNDWETAPFDFPHEGNALRTIGNDLYGVTYVDSPSDSNWLYRFDGTNLTTIGTGTYLTTATNFSNLNNIYDVVEYNGDIYICGEFDRVGSQQISGIARWDGTSWSEVGGGLSGSIPNGPALMFPHKMEVIDGQLYCVGNFRFAGGVEVNGIAAWNGTAWSAVGAGFNGTAYCVAKYNNELYAGGSFTESNGQSLGRIARWDGANWVSPGFDFIDVNPNFIFVHTFYEGANGLYMAGGLKQLYIVNTPVYNIGGIILFDGSNIETFSGGVTGNDIEAVIEDSNGKLLVGGGVFGSGYVGAVQDVTSVEEEESPQLEIHPNPATESITIYAESAISSLQIYSADGRKLFEGSHSDAIDISSYETGVYWVHVKMDHQSVLKKFIKQ